MKTKDEKKPEYSQQTCKVEFTREELEEFAESMSIKMGEMARKEEAKKEVASQFKADIDAIKNECNALAQKIRNKYEYKPVKCLVVRNYKTRMVTYTRTDTGEEHKTRPMTSDEIQMELDQVN